MSYNDWLDIDVLEAYLDGKLDSKMMHQVEKISLEDPFVAQALAGLTTAKKRKQSLSILQKQLQERVAQKPTQTKRWRITSHRLSIASAAAVLFLIVSVFFFMRENARQQTAKNQTKNVDVTIAPKIAESKNNVTEQPINKSGDVAPSDATRAIIDEAMVDAKKNTLAVNTKKTPPVKKEVPENAIVTLVEPAKPTVEPAYKVGKEMPNEEQIKVEGKNQARAAMPVAILKSKADGVNAPTKMLQGRVIDKVTSLPLNAVSIMQAGTSQTTTTNADGVFKIPVEDSANDVTLKFSYLGFKSQEVKVDGSKVGDVKLEQSDNALNEVMVTNNQSKKTKFSDVFVTSSPVEGIETYLASIYRNIKPGLPLTTSPVQVELAFNVNSSGKPIHIKVAKSGGKVFDDEAIRLLKNGGKWIYSSKGTNTAKLSISFNN